MEEDEKDPNGKEDSATGLSWSGGKGIERCDFWGVFFGFVVFGC